MLNPNGETTSPDSDLIDDRLLVTVPEAARMLSISRAKAYELAGSGEIPRVHIGRSVRVPLDELREWIADRAKDSNW